MEDVQNSEYCTCSHAASRYDSESYNFLFDSKDDAEENPEADDDIVVPPQVPIDEHELFDFEF